MIDLFLKNSRKIAFYSLVGYFFSTTFSHFLAQSFFAIALLFSIITFFVEKKSPSQIKLNWFYIFILLFVGWSIISAIAGPTPLKSLPILKEEWLFLMIPVVAFLADTDRKIKTLLKTLAISAIIISLFGILQYFIAPLIYHGDKLSQTPTGHFRVSGGFSHYLTFGNYFAILASLIIGMAPYQENRSTRILFYLSFALTALATILTYSSGPIGALLFGMFLFAMSLGRIKRIAIVSGLVIFAIIMIIFAPLVLEEIKRTLIMEKTGSYDGSRLAIWRTSGRMIEKHPIFGVGQGNYDNLYMQYADSSNTKKFSHAHNDLINIAAYAGLPGAAFFLGLWVIIIWQMFKFITQDGAPPLFRGVAIGTLLGSLVFLFTSQYEATFADEEPRLFLMAIWGLFWACQTAIKANAKVAENIEKA
jgi:O-antigen ligase